MSANWKAMSDDDIIEFLREFSRDSSLTVEDLRAPKLPFVVSVFQHYLAAVEIDIDLIYSPPFKVSSVIENMEPYEEILPICALRTLMSGILQYAGITDLSIKDILEPKPKRTKRIMSALITLWRYTIIKACYYNGLIAEHQSEVDQKQELFNKIELMKQQNADIESDLQNRAKLLSVYKKNQERFEEQNKMKHVLSEEHRQCKKVHASYELKERELAVEIESLKVKLEELDQKILRSPNRLDAEMQQLRQKILDVENRAKENQLISVTAMKKNRDLKDASEKLQKFSESIDSIYSASDKLREAAALVNPSVTKLEKVAEAAKRMDDEVEREVEQKLLNEQWLAKEILNGQKRIEAVKEIMAINKQDCEKVELSYERSQKIAAQMQEVLETSEQVLATEKQKHEDFAAKFVQESALLKSSFQSYIDHTKKKFESPIQENMNPAILKLLRNKNQRGYHK